MIAHVAARPPIRLLAAVAGAAALAAWLARPVYVSRHGFVVPGTLDTRDGVNHHFAITADGGERIDVDYVGVLPDTFHDGAEVVVRGDERSDGLDADVILAKCASRSR
jgi:cytochrome c-type biogenesis protein CcmE